MVPACNVDVGAAFGESTHLPVDHDAAAYIYIEQIQHIENFDF